MIGGRPDVPPSAITPYRGRFGARPGRASLHHFDDVGHPIRYSEFKVGHARYHVVIAFHADPA